MSVYVDNMRAKVGRLLLSHMIADTLDELHQMATLIGVARRWFQDKTVPHYDICATKRKHAIVLGAIMVDRRQLGEIIRRIKRK